MSVRNFERMFTRELGTTPLSSVLQMRVEAARRQLERTDGGLRRSRRLRDLAASTRCGAPSSGS